MKNNINNSELVPSKKFEKFTQLYTPIFIPDLVPVKTYIDALISKPYIVKEYKGNTIIYMWFNKVTGEVYIGSSWKNRGRLSSYYQPSSINKNTRSRICRSLLKYGHSNFSLIILEKCNISNYLSTEEIKRLYLGRESFHISWASKIYGDKVLNIFKTAGSSLGYVHTPDTKLKMSVLKLGERNNMYNKKHTKETRESISLALKGKPKIGHKCSDITRVKISKAHLGKVITKETKDKLSLALKGRVHSIETRAKLSLAMLNKKPNIETREKMKLSHSKPILVRNIINNEIRFYPSIKQAALELNTSSTNIRRHLKRKTVMLNLYLITTPVNC